MQEYHLPPCAPPSLGHTVLIGLGPPTSAAGGPHSYIGLSNSPGPYGYHSPQGPAGVDLG